MKYRNSPTATTIVSSLLVLLIAAFYRPKSVVPLFGMNPDAAFSFAPSMILLALIAMLALIRPDLALAAVAGTLPFTYRSRGFWDGNVPLVNNRYFPLHEILLLIVLGATLVWWLIERETITFDWCEWAVPLAWLVIGTIAMLIAVPEGRAEARREWRWVIVEPLIFYGLVRYWGHKGDTRWWLMRGLLAGSVIVAIIGLLQWNGIDRTPIDGVSACYSDFVVNTGGTVRTSSVFCHPNNLALWQDRAWAIALVLLVGATMLWTRKRNLTTSWWMLVYAGATVATIASLFFTYSKGARFASAAVAIGLSLLPRRWWITILTVVVLGGGLTYSSLAGTERENVLGDSTSARFSIWRSGVAMIADHPILGIGLDQFYFHYNPKFNRGYIDPKLAADPAESNTSHPHNVVLDLWLRMGILGLITFGVLMWRTLRRAWFIWFSNHAQRWIALGCGAALLVGLIHGLVDQGYFSPDLAMVTWLFVGCVDGVFKNIEHRT